MTTTANFSLDLIKKVTEAGNWTDFSCAWLDEIYHIQNDFYWKHSSSTEILILYAFVCTFGGLANIFVIVSFVKTSHLRNLRNYFIVNLAFSDLMLCTVTAPVTLYLTLYLFWPFGNIACQIMASIQAVNLFVSCLTLVLIAMDRFLLTLCPVKWRLAAKAPVICYLFVWLTSLIVAAPYFFAVSAEPVTMFDPWNSVHAAQMLRVCHRNQPEICLEKTWHRLPFSRRAYTLSVLAIQYILPLSALGFAYSQIGSTIRKRVKHTTTIDHERKQLLTKRNRKALLLLLMLVIIYGIAWLPINAYNVLNVLDVIEFSQYKYIFCHLIGMSSACINPIMYALINDSFRSAFLTMLRPLFAPCTKYTTVDTNHSPMNHLQHTNTTMSNSICNLNQNGHSLKAKNLMNLRAKPIIVPGDGSMQIANLKTNGNVQTMKLNHMNNGILKYAANNFDNQLNKKSKPSLLEFNYNETGNKIFQSLSSNNEDFHLQISDKAAEENLLLTKSAPLKCQNNQSDNS